MSGRPFEFLLNLILNKKIKLQKNENCLIPFLSHLKTSETKKQTNKQKKEAPSKDIAIRSEAQKRYQQNEEKRQN